MAELWAFIQVLRAALWVGPGMNKGLIEPGTGHQFVRGSQSKIKHLLPLFVSRSLFILREKKTKTKTKKKHVYREKRKNKTQQNICLREVNMCWLGKEGKSKLYHFYVVLLLLLYYYYYLTIHGCIELRILMGVAFNNY